MPYPHQVYIGEDAVDLGPANGVDDTVTLNAILAANAGSVVRGLPGQNYRTSAPLVIRSGTTLDMTGCTVTLRAGSNCSMLANRAVSTTQRAVTDAAITSGATTLTSATAAFTSTDVGRSVTVAGAGGGVWVGALSATITAVTNATTVTLSRQAYATVSGATAILYDRDTDITVIGGTWDRGANGGTGTANHSLLFRRLDGLKVRDLAVLATGGKYLVAPGDVTRFHVERIHGVGTSSNATVQVNGPASRGVIRDITGTTSDDAIALTADDYEAYRDVYGDITDVLIDGFRGTSSTAVLKIIGGTTVKLRKITARNLGGTAPRAIACVDDTAGATDIDELLIDGVSTATTGATPVIDLSATAGKNAIVRNITDARTDTTNRIIISAVNWSSLTIDGVNVPNSPANMDMLRITGTVGDLHLSNVNAKATDTNASVMLAFYPTSNVARARLHNIAYVNGSACIVASAGSTVGRIVVAGITHTSTGRFAKLYSPTDLTLLGAVLSVYTLGAIEVGTGGSLTLRGAGVARVNSWTGIQITGSGAAPRIINPDFPVDLAVVAKNEDDTAVNLNAALLCGTGRAVCNGTNWKNVYSGLVY